MVGIDGGLTMRNRVINGCCRVKQRSSVSLTTSNQFGEVDRMLGSYVNGSAGTFVQQVGGLASGMTFKRGVKFNDIALSSGYVVLRHRIEVLNTLDLSGQTVTASVKVYHDFGSTTNFKIGLRKPSSGTADTWGSGSSATSVSDVTVACASAATTVVSGTWTLNSTDADLGLEIVVYCDPVSVTTKNVVIGDIQLTLGSEVEQMERRSIGVEDALCKRYYQTYYGSSGLNLFARSYAASAGQSFPVPIPVKVSFRAAPTGTIVGTWVATNALQPSVVSTNTECVGVIFNSVASGDCFVYPNSTSIGATFSAEL